MSREKGQPKTGGRKEGTPNRITADLKKRIEAIIEKNVRNMERDLKKLDPKDRLIILERLLQYAIPRQQAISVEAQIQAEYAAIEQLIDKLPDEAVDEITERLIRLNELNKETT